MKKQRIRKSTKNSVPKEKKAKKVNSYVHFEDYLCTNTFRQKPISKAGIEKLAFKVRSWALGENALIVNDMLDEFGISPKTYHSWRHKNPILQEAHEFMFRRIASTREKGALLRKYDASIVRHKQHIFDEEWRAADAYHAELKKQTAESNVGNITVVIPKSAASDLVPEKTNNKENKES